MCESVCVSVCGGEGEVQVGGKGREGSEVGRGKVGVGEGRDTDE